ncbi:MAG TPA: sensor histidine kinase [Bacteriovoracaceae bacterium]|nr:sensor histidine kinase [Bacteriovoracaceae bacterium]
MPGPYPESSGPFFERFERVETSYETTGLGLGLYITKQIIELHQGNIRVESEYGKGCNFIIELPILDSQLS